jgi:signal transduction histidine kinase
VSAPEPATLDFAAGWEASSLKRERSEATTAVLFMGTLVPLWIAFDAFLEPELLETFTVMRLVATAAAWGVLPIIRRAGTVRALRAWTTAEIAFSGATIALMLPHVRHFPAYVFGFSLFFWGMGAILSWPARWSVGLFAWLLGVISAGFVAWPGMRSPADYVAVGFYVGSAAVVATIMNYIRYRMVREAFAVSHQLAMRNADVERTIEQLREAQARLVASEKLSALGRLLAGLSHEINNPLNVLQNNLDPLRASLDGLLDLARLAGSATPPDLAALRRRCAELDVEATARDVEDAAEMMRAAMGRVRQVHSDLRTFIRGDSPGWCSRIRAGPPRDRAPSRAGCPTASASIWTSGRFRAPRSSRGSSTRSGTTSSRTRSTRSATRAPSRCGRVRWPTGSRSPWRTPDRGWHPSTRRACSSRSSRRRARKGTGLGLAMSYQIVERHGGAMFLDGGYTGGARFVIRLPVRVMPGVTPLADPAARAG